MAALKSQRHHWWPSCVSKRWTGPDGLTGVIRPDGTIKRVHPKELGAIGNGHLVRLGSGDIQETPWDFSYEQEFEQADGQFPGVIDWLVGLPHSPVLPLPLSERYQPCTASEHQLQMLTESVVSLAVRSPCNRERGVSFAESIRGELHGRERNALIGMNIRRLQRACVDRLQGRAKFAVLVSEELEFIYGDGFFHNLSPTIEGVHQIRMVVPITPHHAVAIYQPSAYMRHPAICTLTLAPEEAEFCNSVVQVYSRDLLFFRKQPPALHTSFRERRHMKLAGRQHFFESLFQAMPGVIPPRYPIALPPIPRPSSRKKLPG